MGWEAFVLVKDFDWTDGSAVWVAGSVPVVLMSLAGIKFWIWHLFVFYDHWHN